MALANVHPERFDFDNVAPFEMDRRGDLSLITSGLYLSSADTEEDLTLLSKNGITHILQVGTRYSVCARAAAMQHAGCSCEHDGPPTRELWTIHVELPR